MAKKDTKEKLFENMGKLNPGFKFEEATSIAQPTVGAQQTQQYAGGQYKIMANQLKMVNSPQKFAPAFKEWFQYLGYSPQANNINIQRVRTDIEAIMKEMGYE